MTLALRKITSLIHGGRKQPLQSIISKKDSNSSQQIHCAKKSLNTGVKLSLLGVFALLLFGGKSPGTQVSGNTTSRSYNYLSLRLNQDTNLVQDLQPTLEQEINPVDQTEAKYSSPTEYKEVKYGKTNASILKIDLNNPKIIVKPVLAWGRVGKIETVSSMVKRLNAIGGINAGFYDYTRTNWPIGLVMIDSRVVALNMGDWNRAIFTIDEKNQAQIYSQQHPLLKIVINGKNSILINGVNRKRYGNSTIIYTPEHKNGDTTGTNQFGTEVVVVDDQITQIFKNQGNSLIPKNGYVISFQGTAAKKAEDLKIGEFIKQVINLPEGTKHGVFAGPQLIKDGKININLKGEDFYPRSGIYYSHARAGIGITKDNKLLFIRLHSSRKISFEGMAKIFLNEGAQEAMCFDGGGSSSLIYKGKGFSRRAVSNAILVWEKKI